MTNTDINAALASFAIVRRHEDRTALERRVAFPTGAGFKDAAELVDHIVRCDPENRTVERVLGWLLAGERVWTHFGYYRLIAQGELLAHEVDTAGPVVSTDELVGLQVIRTRKDNGSTVERPLGNVSLGIMAVHNDITRSEALERLKAGEELHSSAWSYRLVREEPEAPARTTIRTIIRASGQSAYVQGYTHVLVTISPTGNRWDQSFRSEAAAKRAKTMAEKAEARAAAQDAPRDYGQDLTRDLPIVPPADEEVDLDAEYPGWRDEEPVEAPKAIITVGPNLITIERAQELVSTAGELNAIERAALVAFVGADDEDLIVALVEALAELGQRKDREDLAKLQEGHRAYQRADRRGWDAQDIAWRSAALKGLQDSRNAAQVAA